MASVQIGDSTVTVGEFNARKATEAMRLLKDLLTAVPDVTDHVAAFTRDYEQRNQRSIDRASARVEFHPDPLYEMVPLLDDHGKPVVDPNGDPVIARRPVLDTEGRPVMGPDPLGHLSEQDWQASGQHLRLPRSPSAQEQMVAAFPVALDKAQTQVMALLALIVMPNRTLKQHARAGTLDSQLHEDAEDLLDEAAADQLLELAVVAGEVIEEQFAAKLDALGDRAGKALRLFGIQWQPKSPTTPSPGYTEDMEMEISSSTSRLGSSTGSPPPSDGTSEPLSTGPDGVSSVPSMAVS